MNATHTIVSVAPFTAIEVGALSGNEATCTCGHVVRTSLSANVARREGYAHADYMNKTGR